MLERIAAAATAILVSAGSVIGVRAGTEEPPYVVVERVGDVEVRRYAARLAAEVTVAGPETEARGRGFGLLAGYIFGGNQGGEKIAMTAPVAQAAPGGAGWAGEKSITTAPVAQAGAGADWTIRFFMPADRTRETLPIPGNPAIAIVNVPAATMAVLRFDGVASPDAVAARRAALLASLAGSRWQATGSVEGWFYDPPWTLPPLRRNEVAVAVAP